MSGHHSQPPYGQPPHSDPHGPAHDEVQMLLGAYVLGGLDGADRRRLEEHLPTCAECAAELSRFAAVPGLLALANGVEGGHPESVRPPPDSLRKLVAAAKAKRSAARRRMVLAAAAAVLVVAGSVTGAVWFANRSESEPSLPPGAELVAAPGATAPAGQPPTSGKVVLEPTKWGTQLRLTMYYYAPDTSGALTAWAVSKDGAEELAANWTTPKDGRCYVIGSTSIERDRIVTVEVRDAGGTTLFKATT